MHCFPSELLDRAASSYELTELKAMELIDGPISLHRGDRRALAIVMAACGKPSDAVELLNFGAPEEPEEPEEPEQHTLIELPPEEKAAHAAALLSKFEVIVGGPDGHSR